MKNQNEYEKRCKAIQLYDEGVGFNKILQFQRGEKRIIHRNARRTIYIAYLYFL